MEILIDADVIIQGEQGKFDLESWLAIHSEEKLAVAAITVSELWHGVERAIGKRRIKRRRIIRTILKRLPVFSFTERTAYMYAKLWAYLEAKGMMIGNHDLIVAATAREKDYAVATFNKKHFSKVPGLKIVVPT